MSDDIFRIVIAVAVGLTFIVFVVQAFVVLALYRSVRGIQGKVEPLPAKGQSLGELLHEGAERARHRLEQIDSTVESTVEQVEHVGETVKRAVMRPVKEVNGLAAGISAAVATLVKKPRKSSVDSATQDEEM